MKIESLLAQTNKTTVRKTKIIATMGPASRAPERLRQLITAGVNVFRLNFSHGSPAEHLKVLTDIRIAADELSTPVAVLQDLSGPKIRISMIEGDFAPLADKGTVDLFKADGSKSTSEKIYVEGLDPAAILQPGQMILLADGLIELRTESVSKALVRCHVTKGGRIRSRVGIAFPDSVIDLPAATEKDIEHLRWGIANGVDYAAISFVKNAEDVITLRKLIDAANSPVQLIAKIERRAALENIEAILDVSDGVMVARGDLGLELPLEQLPMLQRRLIEKANYRGKPAIVATQMLHSMVTSVRPTRAEVSDIATAVMSGADAVMLSEETAIGEHPVEAVQYLGKIAHAAEQTFAFEEFRLRLRDADRATVPDAVAYAACAAAVKVTAGAIIACTETGNTARLVAKYRPQQPLYGVSRSAATLRRMALYWGVIPLPCPETSTHVDEIEVAMKIVKAREHLGTDTRAVITGGLAVGKPGATNVLEIREM